MRRDLLEHAIRTACQIIQELRISDFLTRGKPPVVI